MEEALVNVIQPVLELSVYMAARYANACGRDIVTQKDVEYAMKFVAMHKVGDQLGSYLSDEEDSDAESEAIETTDEGEFTRYEGDDPTFLKMNESYDTWDAWTPGCIAEEVIKSAIDKLEGSIGLENVV